MELGQGGAAQQPRGRLNTNFVLQFQAEAPAIDQFAWALQAIDTAVLAGIWMEAILSPKSSSALRALKALERNRKAGERFFPGSGAGASGKALGFVESLDPFDPLDIGTLVGLNAWLRSSLSPDPTLESLVVDDARRESPIVIAFALPVAAKGVGMAAGGALAVLKAVNEYYSIKKKRREIKDGSQLSAAKVRNKEASTEKLRAQTEEIRARIADRTAAKEKKLAADLAVTAPKAGKKRIAKAASVGTKAAAVAVHELERNPGVSELRRAKRSDRRSSKPSRRRQRP